MARMSVTTTRPAMEREVDLRLALIDRADAALDLAATLGEDGHYRQAIAEERLATNLLDVVTFIDTGDFPETKEPVGDCPGEKIRERWTKLDELSER